MSTIGDSARNPDIQVITRCSTQARDVPGRWWLKRYEGTVEIRDSARAIIGDDPVDLRLDVDWAWVEREAMLR